MSESPQRPLCPVCHSARHVESLPQAYENGMKHFAPPVMPQEHTSMRSAIMLGAVLIGCSSLSIIILSGSNSVSLPQVILIYACIIATLTLSFLAFRRVGTADAQAQRRLPIWDEALHTWQTLWYCTEDRIAFDPEHHQKIPESDIPHLLAV